MRHTENTLSHPCMLLEMCRVLNAFGINTDMKTIFPDQNCSFGPYINNERSCEWIKVAKRDFKILINLSYSHHSRKEILLQGDDDTVTSLLKCNQEDPEVIEDACALCCEDYHQILV